MRVSPSNIKPVTTVVEVSLANMGLKERGSELVERIISPPYFPAGVAAKESDVADNKKTTATIGSLLKIKFG